MPFHLEPYFLVRVYIFLSLPEKTNKQIQPAREEGVEAVEPHKMRVLPPLVPLLSLSFYLWLLPGVKGEVAVVGGGCVEEGLSNPH